MTRLIISPLLQGFGNPPICFYAIYELLLPLWDLDLFHSPHIYIYLHRNTLTLQHLSELFNAARRTTVEETISCEGLVVDAEICLVVAVGLRFCWLVYVLNCFSVTRIWLVGWFLVEIRNTW